MSTKVEESVCDTSESVLRGRNFSMARGQANINFTIAYTAVGLAINIICVAAWLYWHNKYERTRVRPTAFVLLASLASLCQLSYGPMWVVFNSEYPCFLGALFVIMMIPFMATTVLGRLILFSFLSQFSAAVSEKLKRREDVELSSMLSRYTCESSLCGLWQWFGLVLCKILHPTKPITSERELQALRFLITTRGIGVMVLTFTLPVFVVIVAYLLASSDGPVYRDCTNCAMSTNVMAMSLAFLVLFLLKGLVDWILMVRQARSNQRISDDVWGLKTECLQSLCAIVVIVVGFILGPYGPRIYPYSHLFMLSLGFWLLLASQTVLQLFMAWRTQVRMERSSKTIKAKLDFTYLNSVLVDANLCSQFERHLISEFAVESLYFLKDVQDWRARYYAVAPNARLARARRIYNGYISDSGMYAVNVSSRVKEDISKALDSNKAELDLFDSAIGEIYSMLLGGPVIRFHNNLEVAATTTAGKRRKSRRKSSLSVPASTPMQSRQQQLPPNNAGAREENSQLAQV